MVYDGITRIKSENFRKQQPFSGFARINDKKDVLFMEKYLLWLRIVEFSAVAAVLTGCAVKMRNKRFALYFKIYLCAAASYALFLLYNIVSSVCLMMQMPADVGDTGVFACGAFLFSANFSQMDGLADERTERTRRRSRMALLAPAALLALFCGLSFSSDAAPTFKLLGLLSVSGGIAASYYHLKHILLPADPLGLLDIVRPGNILALLFLLCSTLLTGASAAGYTVLEAVAGALSAIFLCAMCVFSVKEAEKWKMSI